MTGGGHPEPADFAVRIPRAGRAELLALVRDHVRHFTERDALQVLRSAHVSADAIEELVVSRKLLSTRSVRKAVVLHPATPRAIAIDLLEGLLWRDLLDVGRAARAPMPVRRSANQRILERLPRMTLGEKAALARLADRALLTALLDEKEERVFAPLLQNPRLMPDDLVAWITVGGPDPERLAVLAGDPRWSRLPEVRGALLACAQTPRAVAIGLLANGTRAEWRRLMDDPRADRLLSACARRLYEETPQIDRPRPYL
jgi:hypothetical protein